MRMRRALCQRDAAQCEIHLQEGDRAPEPRWLTKYELELMKDNIDKLEKQVRDLEAFKREVERTQNSSKVEDRILSLAVNAIFYLLMLACSINFSPSSTLSTSLSTTSQADVEIARIKADAEVEITRIKYSGGSYSKSPY